MPARRPSDSTSLALTKLSCPTNSPGGKASAPGPPQPVRDQVAVGHPHRAVPALL